MSGSPDAAKGEFSQQGTLVDFFEESSAKGIGNLKDRAEHTLRQGIQENQAVLRSVPMRGVSVSGR